MPSPFETLRILDFDHLEFAVSDLDRAAEVYLRMGFERVGTRTILERSLRSYLMVQNRIAIVLSHSQDAGDPIAKYVQKHGDGVATVAFLCEDSVSTLELVAQRGAEIVEAPKTTQRDFGKVVTGSIKAFGDVRHAFVSRQGNLFAEGFEIPVKALGTGPGLHRIDHVACDVEPNQLAEWARFYGEVLGLHPARAFDVHTDAYRASHKAMESPDQKIRLLVSEPTRDGDDVQNFLNVHHGAGVRHVALTTEEILATVSRLRKNGIVFRTLPTSEYYDHLRARVPAISEDLGDLQRNGVLVDGDDRGYLLHAYTQDAVGPFFYEILQRKGHDGYGESGLPAPRGQAPDHS